MTASHEAPSSATTASASAHTSPSTDAAPAARRLRMVLLVEDAFTVLSAKTAVGVLRYSPHEVVAAVDSKNAGKTVEQVLGFGGPVPVVATMAEALAFKPDVAVIGVAPTGGGLPPSMRATIADAIVGHVEIWSGLHTFLADDPDFTELANLKGVRLWDVRRPRPDLVVADGSALKSRAFVVLTVGSDCNCGKMTTVLELEKHVREKGWKAGFVATGQTGILIEGAGTPLDAVPGDFMSGEVERLMMDLERQGTEIIFIEGQGAIVHPGFGAVTLALMLGAMPDAYILCHQPTRKNFRPNYDVALPPLPTVIRQYEGLMEYHKAPKVACVALNTYDLPEADARKTIAETEASLGLPTCDPIRDGVGRLWEALEPLVKKKLGK